MTATALRPRSVVEIIDAAFQLLRWHYVPLLTVYAIALIPPFLLDVILPEPINLIGSFLQILLGPVVAGAVALMVSGAYLGQPLQVGEAIRRVLARLASVLGAAVLQWTIIFAIALMGALGVGIAAAVITPIGAIVVGLALLPVFVTVAVWTFAMQMAVIIEGQRALASFDRSRTLAQGHVLRILGLFLLTAGISIAVGAGVGGILYLLGSALGTVGERLIMLTTTVAMLVVYPIWGVVVTLMYYDLRIRKEGFDLQILASQMEAVPAAVR